MDFEPQSHPPRWHLDRSDWQRFTDLTSSVRPLADFGTCNDAAAYFTDVLHSVALQSVPKTSGRFPNHPIPWWNADCTVAVREQRSAFLRLCRHCGEPVYLETFRQGRAQARCILKDAQRRSWRVYLSSSTFSTPLTAVFKLKSVRFPEGFLPLLLRSCPMLWRRWQIIKL